MLSPCYFRLQHTGLGPPCHGKALKNDGQWRGQGAGCNVFMLLYNGPVRFGRALDLGGENIMKSFWFGSIAAVIIAVVAGVVLSGSGMTTGERYSSANTRL